MVNPFFRIWLEDLLESDTGQITPQIDTEAEANQFLTYAKEHGVPDVKIVGRRARHQYFIFARPLQK